MQKIPFNKKSGNADVQAIIITLNKKQRHGVLATDSGGQPYTSLVAFALSNDAKGVIFATPRKTSKYQNILKNRNVSFMIDTRSNTATGYMRSEAVTILGTASPLRKGKKRDELCKIFTKKHPELAGFVNAPSTALIFIAIKKALHTGQFQTVTEWEVKK
jgi:nitroimidazol reductase NimA-like FMN-containing flavoprotein (pyridoxamine 5'-phosphate oxidase superfamily)